MTERRRRNARRYRRVQRRNFILLVSLLVFFSVTAGRTIAYLQTSTGNVTNTFTPGKVRITIDETVDKINNTKSEIKFTNPPGEDAVPVYIRAMLVIYWTDTFDLTDGGGDNPTEQIVPMPAEASVAVPEELGENWFKADDIYYYALPVEPGAETAVMLKNAITVTLPDGSTAKCYIDVRAEAIQASPADAVEAAWLDVNVDANNGKLVSASTSN